MPSVMITGASRGIGLEFARQYAADGWRVYACCRTPAKAAELRALSQRHGGGEVSVHALDVDDDASVQAAARELQGASFDVLINNAGINPHRDTGLGGIDYAAWERCLRTNVLGPVRVAEAFAGRLAGEKKLITISSRMGSIAENGASNAIIYRSSKAAVNMAMKGVANGLADRGVIVVSFHPGWVKTDMGGPGAALEIPDSVRQMRKAIAGLGVADNGGFLNYDGSPIPW
jgi:NAD(P)-dependent dehydrogenase (short-subunit alcohol dehydrogenase family)